jgi:cyclopropane fatty-acyl-phospholipid synthase-like methyltransferase
LTKKTIWSILIKTGENMFVNDIIEKIDNSNHLISMTPVEKIIELGYILKFDENTKILDLCCGYGEMLKILCQAYKINGKGIDISKEFIDIGNERIKNAGLSEKIKLECNDIQNCTENDYDVVILTEPYIFGEIGETIKKLEKFIKSDGKIIFGTLIASEKDLPEELVEFDGNNLHTEYDIYKIILNNNYSISYIGRSTQGEWDKYFTWSSRRIVECYQNAKTHEEKEKQKEWLYKWYGMYAKYRIKYEKWGLFAIEKINIR